MISAKQLYNNSTPAASLSPEVWVMIAECLTPGDFTRLRQTCKLLRSYAVDTLLARQRCNNNTPAASLPYDVWTMITKCLTLYDLAMLQQTCKVLGGYALLTHNRMLAEKREEITAAKLLDPIWPYNQLVNCIEEDDELKLVAWMQDQDIEPAMAGLLDYIYYFISMYPSNNVSQFILARYGCKRTAEGTTMMHYAADYGDVAVARKLASNFGISVDTRDSDGCTPLFYAVSHAQTDVVRILVTEARVDINGTCIASSGKTPLHVAVTASVDHIAEFLLVNSANPDAIDINGDTPLHLAAKNGQTPTTYMLIAHRANINAQNGQGYSPLTLAIHKGRIDTIQLLIILGADINVPDKNGKTPLQHAMCTADHCIWYLFTQHPSTDFAYQDKTGRTLLAQARASIKTCSTRKRKQALELILEGALFQHWK
jgi:Ankyrin repeats (3 copies)/F-box domain